MQYDLVFEGGGAKGLAFVGALDAFEAAGHTPGRLLGTSAGAITATALAAGYTTAEVSALLDERAPDGRPIFATFLGDPSPFTEAELQEGALRRLLSSIDLPLMPDALERRLDEEIVRRMASSSRLRHLLAFFERGGWFGADAFVDWMRRLLNNGVDRGQPRRYAGLTLADLYQATGRELTLIAADTTDARMLVLNHRTAPGVPVEYAARMSMSVPLLWEEVTWRGEWGAYRGREIAGHTIVDGGLLSNFPIELFVSSDQQVTAVMGTPNTGAVLGFLIDETLAVPGAPPAPGAAAATSSLAELATVRRLKGLANAATQAHDLGAIEAFEQLIVRLPAKSFGTTEFDMDPARRAALIAAGREAAAGHLRPQTRGGFRGLEVGPDAELADRRARRILGD